MYRALLQLSNSYRSANVEYLFIILFTLQKYCTLVCLILLHSLQYNFLFNFLSETHAHRYIYRSLTLTLDISVLRLIHTHIHTNRNKCSDPTLRLRTLRNLSLIESEIMRLYYDHLNHIVCMICCNIYGGTFQLDRSNLVLQNGSDIWPYNVMISLNTYFTILLSSGKTLTHYQLSYYHKVHTSTFRVVSFGLFLKFLDEKLIVFIK